MNFRIGKFARRSLSSPASLLSAGVILLACVVNVTPARSNTAVVAPAEDTKQLEREGAKLGKTTGTFRQASNRISFVVKGNNQAYVCLENLMLQRVSGALAEQNEFAEWIVTGEFTEFNNDNFLILKTANRVE